MKKYIAGTLVVLLISIVSVIYKGTLQHTSIFTAPFLSENGNTNTQKLPILYLYIFMSKNNCVDCLGIIEVLNRLPSEKFVVMGIVPESQLGEIELVRSLTGATFPIAGDKNYKAVVPRYTPSVIGLSKNGEIFCVIPGVPGAKIYLEDYLNSLYNKLLAYLLRIVSQ